MLELHELENPIDVSKEAGKPEGTIQATHIIKGFEVEVVMLQDHEERSFFFGTWVGEGIPLLVSLNDEEVYNKCVDFVVEALN